VTVSVDLFRMTSVLAWRAAEYARLVKEVEALRPEEASLADANSDDSDPLGPDIRARIAALRQRLLTFLNSSGISA
jgi:hypothetical protein